jgi:hypothetical protein
MDVFRLEWVGGRRSRQGQTRPRPRGRAPGGARRRHGGQSSQTADGRARVHGRRARRREAVRHPDLDHLLLARSLRDPAAEAIGDEDRWDDPQTSTTSSDGHSSSSSPNRPQNTASTLWSGLPRSPVRTSRGRSASSTRSATCDASCARPRRTQAEMGESPGCSPIECGRHRQRIQFVLFEPATSKHRRGESVDGSPSLQSRPEYAVVADEQRDSGKSGESGYRRIPGAGSSIVATEVYRQAVARIEVPRQTVQPRGVAAPLGIRSALGTF